MIGHIIIVNVISLLLSFFSIYVQFEKDFEIEIKDAIKIQENISKIMRNRIDYLGGDYEICSSIVFPELIRYSALKDKMESYILMTFYKLHGSKFSNYSVGYFQMKPSFIEYLEKNIQKYDLQKFSFIWEYPKDLNAREIRKLRVDRILDINWQIDYLICFTLLIQKIHNANNLSKKDQISFIASAYNSGWWFDKTKIFKYENVEMFPHGKSNNGKNYNYSDIAVYYYSKILLIKY